MNNTKKATPLPSSRMNYLCKVLFLFVFIAVVTKSQFLRAQSTLTLTWNYGLGSVGYDGGKRMAIDQSGNIFLYGRLSATIDFDPGASTYNVIPATSNDYFVAKYSSAGAIQWAYAFSVTINAIALDGFGNLYICGSTNATIDMNPGAGVANVVGLASASAMFFAKYDTNGLFVFAKDCDGISMGNSAISTSIATDASSNIYICGTVAGTVDIDPSASVNNVTSAGLKDIFFAKYDSGGNLTWCKNFGGSEDDEAMDIAVDNAGDVYTSGSFKTTVDFNAGAGTYTMSSATSTYTAFFTKYDASGNFTYAKQFLASAGVFKYGVTDNILVEYDGTILLTGYYTGTTDFDASASTYNLTSAGGEDMYFTEYSPAGNLIWAKSVGSTSTDGITSVFTDDAGNIYLSGKFTNTVDFNPGAAVNSLVSASVGSSDGFIARYDADGNYQWAFGMGASSADINYGVVVDDSYSVITTGEFAGTVDFDYGAGTSNKTATGSWDIFIGSFTQPPILLPLNLISFTAENMHNLITLDWITASEENTSHFEIERSYDGTNFEMIGSVNAIGNSNWENEYTFTDDVMYYESKKIYYQLRMVDVNENFTYSDLISVNIISDDDPLHIFPNPASSFITIDISDEGLRNEIQILNVGNQIIYKNTLTNSNQIKIDIANWQKGIYLVKVCNGKECHSEKILIE